MAKQTLDQILTSTKAAPGRRKKTLDELLGLSTSVAAPTQPEFKLPKPVWQAQEIVLVVWEAHCQSCGHIESASQGVHVRWTRQKGKESRVTQLSIPLHFFSDVVPRTVHRHLQDVTFCQHCFEADPLETSLETEAKGNGHSLAELVQEATL